VPAIHRTLVLQSFFSNMNDCRAGSIRDDRRVNPIPALHTAQYIDLIFTGVLQVIEPIAHEQARATSARPRSQVFLAQ
jgi:hypothetical protein